MALSPITAEWEALFRLYLISGLSAAGVSLALLLLGALRYRRGGDAPDAIKPGRVPGSRGSAASAVLLALLVIGLLFGISLGTFNAITVIEQVPSQGLVIEVHGFQWNWRFVYPNGKVSMGQAIVPVGQVVIFKVTSDDVFHKFQLPEFKIGVDAIPGKVNVIWIQPQQVGQYNIFCAELCGLGHSLMRGTLLVVEQASFQAWYGGGGA